MGDTYQDLFDQISKKEAEFGYEKLSEKEQIVYCVWWLEAEVNNGGFDQFFFNSAGDRTYDTLEALETIGAPGMKKTLEEAIKIVFGERKVPTDILERRDFLTGRTDEEQDKISEELRTLNNRVWQSDEPIPELIEKHWKAN